MYLSSEEEDLWVCRCGVEYILRESRLCYHCTNDWISENSIGQQLEEEGHQQGFEAGAVDAVQDTIYRRARDDYLPDSYVPVPEFAEVDPNSFIAGYVEGYQRSYNETFERHRPLLSQLQNIHILYWTRLRLLAKIGKHPLMDFHLLALYESYLNKIN